MHLSYLQVLQRTPLSWLVSTTLLYLVKDLALSVKLHLILKAYILI